MERRGINILCVQETRWKGGEGQGDWKWVQLFYYGADGKRNGVGIVLDGELKKSVLALNRESDRIMWMKIEICEVMVNLISVYAPQAGCDEEEKDMMVKIPQEEGVWIGGDLNVHVGDSNEGASEANMGKHGLGKMNKEGERIVTFARANRIAILNTYFSKSSARTRTFTSGGKNTQVDYIL